MSNSTQHTPGPWKIKNGELIYTSDDMRGVAAILTSGYPSGNAPTSYEVEANARLIAAAPELLSQLKEAMRLAAALEDVLKCSGCDCSAEQVGWDKQHEGFRAAIAKAEGRA